MEAAREILELQGAEYYEKHVHSLMLVRGKCQKARFILVDPLAKRAIKGCWPNIIE